MGKRILLVEDEAHVAAVIKKRLESKGYEVITAADGRAGLNMARTGRPDLIVLDLILPILDGYQVCSLLKRDEACRGIPIIMLTARTQESDRERGMLVGANAFLTKPFKHPALLKQIAALLDKTEAGR